MKIYIAEQKNKNIFIEKDFKNKFSFNDKNHHAITCTCNICSVIIYVHVYKRSYLLARKATKAIC